MYAFSLWAMLSIMDQLLPDDFFRSGGDVIHLLGPAHGIDGFHFFCDTFCGLHWGNQGFHALLSLLVKIVCQQGAFAPIGNPESKESAIPLKSQPF